MSNNKEDSEEINNELLKLQRIEVEEEFRKIQEIRNNKGKTAAIFNTMKKIRGDKKSSSELVAMKNPDNDDLIFNPEVLKSVSLDYCSKIVNATQISKMRSILRTLTTI